MYDSSSVPELSLSDFLSADFSVLKLVDLSVGLSSDFSFGFFKMDFIGFSGFEISSVTILSRGFTSAEEPRRNGGT